MKRRVLIRRRNATLAAISTAALLVVGIGCAGTSSSESPSEPRYVLIDGGAHRGEVIALFETTELHSQYPWEVYAIEANPNLIDSLRRWDNITIIDQAMSTEEGSMEFFLGEQNTRQSSLYDRPFLNPEPILVKSFDFSQWIETNFSLDDYVILSLDIQGGEFPVLEKMVVDSTTKYLDRLYIDWHPNIAGRTSAEHSELLQKIIDEGVVVTNDCGQRAFLTGTWVDTLLDPPTIEVHGVDFVEAGTPVRLEVEAAAHGVARLERVEFVVDGAAVGVDTEAPYEVTWTAGEAGRHIVMASAHDSEGNVAVSAPINFFVGKPALEWSIVRSADDAEERVDNGSMRLPSDDLELIEADRGHQMVGLRFADIRIPRGAQVKEAYLQFTVKDVSADPTDLTIHAELAGNAATFTRVRGNISSRKPTSASVSWSPEPWEARGERSLKQRTPDLAALVQEVIAQPGWQEGNALVFMISGAGRRSASSYDGDPTAAPVLYIELAEGSG